MTAARRHILFATTLLFVSLLVGACDNSVEPFSGEIREFYAIHGFLDTLADTQFVRVEPIRSAVERTPASPLDARVATRETGGPEIVWQDSLVTLDDGSLGHLFFSTAPVRAGREYTFLAERADGAASIASTRIPDAPSHDLDLPQFSNGFWVEVITWSGLDDTPDQATVFYEISLEENGPVFSIPLRYRDRGTFLRGAWRVEVRLTVDQQEVRSRLGLDTGNENAFFHGLRMVVERRSAEWDLVNRENVLNGRGFFASMDRSEVRWQLPLVVVTALGYQDRQK